MAPAVGNTSPGRPAALTEGHELVLSTCFPFDALTSGPERYLLHATLMKP